MMTCEFRALTSFRHHVSIPFVTALLFCAGCSTVFDARSQKTSLMNLYAEGEFKEAAEVAAAKAKSRGGTGDALMWRLEEGSCDFAAAEYESSLKSFRRAEAIIKDFDDRATVNVRQGVAELGSMATNPNTLPYKGDYVDRILLNVHKALDYFALGDAEGARVELRRVHERQKEAERRFEEEINEAEKAAREKNVDAEKTLNSSAKLKAFTKTLAERSNQSYADFANPFATYLSAIGYLSDGNTSEALVDFRNLHKMIGGNQLVQRDLVTCARAIGSAPSPHLSDVPAFDYSLTRDIVFVIFANGLAAAKKQVAINLILPPPVGYAGVAFPILEYFPKPYESLSVKIDGASKPLQTSLIADMDAIISRSYKKALAAMIIRTVLSVAAKETANVVIVETARQQGAFAWIAAMIATGIYKYTFNTADTRCWQTLPKEYQITHFKRPPPGTPVTLRVVGTGGGSLIKTIKLDPKSRFAIIYVQSPSPGVMNVKTFHFN